MTTLNEAREAIYQLFVDAWQPTGYPFTFDNDVFTTPLTPWARLIVRHNLGTQDTLGRPGTRRFERQGIVMTQVFTPINQGVAEADSLTQLVRNVFEGGFPPGTNMYFINVTPREVGLDGKWYQVNIDADFRYFETR